MMNRRRLVRLSGGLIGLAASRFHRVAAGAVDHERMTLPGGTTIDYAVVVPDDFDSTAEHPVLLALPPGGQGIDLVDALIERWWGHGAKRGWVVVSPAAPNGRLFFQGSEVHIPAFLDRMAETFRPRNGRYALAGVSNGGLSAFRIALAQPERFRALIGAPGYPPTEEEFGRIGDLVGTPVALYVGERDGGWREASERTVDELTRLGGEARLTVVPDTGHILDEGVDPDDLFDFLDVSLSDAATPTASPPSDV